MSTGYYGVDDYGMLFDKETMEIVLKALGYEGNYNLYDMMWTLEDEGVCEYISDFRGESAMLYDSGIGMWNDAENYVGDPICFYPLSNKPSLFRRAYNGMDDVIAEIKENIGKYLPEDFDYRSRIRRITGTYYG